MRFQILAAAVTLLAALPVQSLTIDLGDASGYNGFFRTEFQSGPSDSQGALAAGGNIDLTGYTVNTLGQTAVSALVAGGSLTQSGGDINGNVVIGGTYSSSNGGGIHSGTLQQNSLSLPVDFNQTFQQLDLLSQSLSVLGTPTAINSGKLTFAGDGSDSQQIFNVSGNDLTNAWGWFVEDIDNDQETIINVSGVNIDIDAGDYLLKLSDWTSVFRSNVLFNFFEAETINLHGAFYGSILATGADIAANGGSVDGQVIANSWLGATQLNAPLFTPSTTVTVPEPSSLALLMLGVVGLTIGRRTVQR